MIKVIFAVLNSMVCVICLGLVLLARFYPINELDARCHFGWTEKSSDPALDDWHGYSWDRRREDGNCHVDDNDKLMADVKHFMTVWKDGI